MPAFRFKRCRLLLGNVWNRELSLIQRRILRRLRNKRRSIQRNLSLRENLNSNIKLQTTRKLSLFYGHLPIRENRGRERTAYIPFLLNLETRLDVILVRNHFSHTLTSARQLISHRRVCVNHGLVSMTHWKVSQGDLISFTENEARKRGEEIRRSFYIDFLVGKIIGKFLPLRMWRRTKKEWYSLLKTKRGCRLLLQSRFLQDLRSSIQEEDFERTKKFGSTKVCLGSDFPDHNRIKRNFFLFKYFFLVKRRKDKNYQRTTRDFKPFLDKSSLYTLATSSDKEALLSKIRIKRIQLPTHYLEVNYRTLHAILFYGPKIAHIPHHIRQKDLHLLLWTRNTRAQDF
nr:ribosomal protein S4 [Thurnia sphaerocephala]